MFLHPCQMPVAADHLPKQPSVTMSVLDVAQGDGVVEDGVARVVVEAPDRLGEDHVLQKGMGGAKHK